MSNPPDAPTPQQEHSVNLTLRTFIKEIFQDVDDGFSSKRTAFFVFIILLAACVIAAVFWKVGVPAMIWNGLVDLIKWIGAAILGERAPAALAALRGGQK